MNVTVSNLRREFGRTIALDDISFTFSAGSVVGFVGPNGAGKTTTMRILATLDEPTAGDAAVDGASVTQDPEKVRRLVGYVPDALPGQGDITVHEYLDFFARAYGLRGEARRMALAGVEEFTRLAGLREKLLKALSKGMKQRVSLARALIHDPPVLIMDEPAAGLDPRARVELRELLRLLAEQQKAILISSHILTELTEICNHVVIIEKGRILEDGSIGDIIDRTHPVRTVIIRPLDRLDELSRDLLEMPGIVTVRPAGKALAAEIDGGEDACCELLAQIIQRGYRIAEFSQKQAGLEEVFMSITKGELG